MPGILAVATSLSQAGADDTTLRGDRDARGDERGTPADCRAWRRRNRRVGKRQSAAIFRTGRGGAGSCGARTAPCDSARRPPSRQSAESASDRLSGSCAGLVTRPPARRLSSGRFGAGRGPVERAYTGAERPNQGRARSNFGPEEIEALLERRVDASRRPDVARRLLAKTAGNPFFHATVAARQP